jgi:hypothetical protein
MRNYCAARSQPTHDQILQLYSSQRIGRRLLPLHAPDLLPEFLSLSRSRRIYSEATTARAALHELAIDINGAGAAAAADDKERPSAGQQSDEALQKQIRAGTEKIRRLRRIARLLAEKDGVLDAETGKVLVTREQLNARRDAILASPLPSSNRGSAGQADQPSSRRRRTTAAALHSDQTGGDSTAAAAAAAAESSSASASTKGKPAPPASSSSGKRRGRPPHWTVRKLEERYLSEEVGRARLPADSAELADFLTLCEQRQLCRRAMRSRGVLLRSGGDVPPELDALVAACTEHMNQLREYALRWALADGLITDAEAAKLAPGHDDADQKARNSREGQQRQRREQLDGQLLPSTDSKFSVSVAAPPAPGVERTFGWWTYGGDREVAGVGTAENWRNANVLRAAAGISKGALKEADSLVREAVAAARNQLFAQPYIFPRPPVSRPNMSPFLMHPR